MLKVGLIINPVAGIGGRVGLKGSDGLEIQSKALSMGAVPLADQRVKETLIQLEQVQSNIDWYCADGAMGGALLNELGLDYQTIYSPSQSSTSPEDTVATTKALQEAGVDIVLFAGGDGTARDVLNGLDDEQLCLGIPAGCKIYSGVFAVTPIAAAEVIKQILAGELYQFTAANILDIDEEQYRQGTINTRLYGDMRIPETAHYVQNVKIAGKENEELVKEDIAAWLMEIIEDDTLYIIGSGRICMALKEQLGFDGTLIGVDAVLNHELVAKDANEDTLMSLIESHDGPVKLIITPIGGQGILLGRGNHTICHRVIEHLGMKNTWVVASKSKLKELDGRPLRLDTGDTELDKRLSGYIPVITGYDDQVIYQLDTF